MATYQVGDIAELTKKTSLVDVCCGTGTIGLTLADRVGQVLFLKNQDVDQHFNQVVGVEMVQEAVRDAIKNAEENKVTAKLKFYKTVVSAKLSKASNIAK